MRPLLILLVLTPTLAACPNKDADLTARVEALEAQYHSQARRLKALEAEVGALKTDKGTATVVDLTKSDGDKPAPEPPKGQ